MTEHPILFSTPMVQAILAGRKTMTRRIVKPQPDPEGDGVTFMPVAPCLDWESHYKELWRPWHWETAQGESIAKDCPYGEVGDLLYVKETYTILEPEHCEGMSNRFLYKADHHEANEQWRMECIKDGYPYKWKSGMFMTKIYARTWLKITSLRVERLQDINPNDAADEGVEYWNVDPDAFEGGELVADYKNYTWKDDENSEDYFFPTFANPVDSFRTLWQSINGEESWKANPFVWVIEFKKIDKK